jgi:hypothetical protein
MTQRLLFLRMAAGNAVPDGAASVDTVESWLELTFGLGVDAQEINKLTTALVRSHLKGEAVSASNIGMEDGRGDTF